MPTRGRPQYARQAVEYFLRQDYARRELVIVEHGTPSLAHLLPEDPRIRIVPADTATSIGALRNLACSKAQGDVIVQWDDDDWYGPQRISRQLEVIRSGRADVCGLRDATFFDLERWRFGRWDARLHRRMFVHDVHGGTLAFRRSVWERLARYPDRSLAEDAGFLALAVRRGARLVALPAEDLFVYVRHGGNSWVIEPQHHPGWQECPEPALPAADRAFYAQRSAGAPDRVEHPLVSCIMPTYERRRFLPAAIAYFRRQDYAERELVVLDDGSDPVADLVPTDDPKIIYHRLDRRLILGAKRNLACELSRGTLVAHWDDDDWQSPHRLSRQVSGLVDSGHDLSGASAITFWSPAARAAWRYTWPSPGRIWAAGNTLMYPKELWRRSPFPEVATGEDSRFVWARGVRSMCDVSDAETVVGVIHSQNTVRKAVRSANWRRAPDGHAEKLIGADAAFYRGIS